MRAAYPCVWAQLSHHSLDRQPPLSDRDPINGTPTSEEAQATPIDGTSVEDEDTTQKNRSKMKRKTSNQELARSRKTATQKDVEARTTLDNAGPPQVLAELVSCSGQQLDLSMKPREMPTKRRKCSPIDGTLPMRKAPLPSLQQPLITTAYRSASSLNGPDALQQTHSPRSDGDQRDVDGSQLASSSQNVQITEPITQDVAQNDTHPEHVPVASKGPTSDPEIARPSTPPRKMMKLRADGKLGSPNGISEHARSKRGRKPRVSERRVAVLPYGYDHASKERVGKKLDSILCGDLRVPERGRADTAKHLSNAPNPPKQTHPFFLGQAKTLQHTASGNSPKKPVIPPSSHATLDVGNAAPPRAWPTFTSTFDKILKYPKLSPPPWPSGDIAHVRGLDPPPLLSSITKPHTRLSNSAGKMKSRPASIDDDDERFLEHFSRLHLHGFGECDSQKPSRLIFNGMQLRWAVEAQMPFDWQHAPRHAAVRHMHESLEDASSAWDRNQCENRDWTSKYAPACAAHVLQDSFKVALIKDWLLTHIVNNVEGAQAQVQVLQPKHKRKRGRPSDLNNFVVSDDDDDNNEEPDTASPAFGPGDNPSQPMAHSELPERMSLLQKKTPIRQLTPNLLRESKAIILSGPHGCGKTASVYAIAQELSFEVFELNSGSRRSGRDIVDKVGDMALNHLVGSAHFNNDANEQHDNSEHVQEEIESKRQSIVQSFFKTKSAQKSSHTKSTKQNIGSAEASFKKSKPQKQSLILLEEVDVLFDEDKNFWSTVFSLLKSSRRPMIMTCTDETLLPAADLHNCSILRFFPPPFMDAVNYLLLLSAYEGHLLQREAVQGLYASTRGDLRSTIQQLQFWCQMGLNDSKGGIGWHLTQSDRDSHCYGGNGVRVVSGGTYRPYLGMLSSNEPVENESYIDQETKLLRAAENEWSYFPGNLIDWSDVTVEPTGRVKKILKNVKDAEDGVEASSDDDVKAPSEDCEDHFPDAVEDNRSWLDSLRSMDSCLEAMSASDIIGKTTTDASRDGIIGNAALQYTASYGLLPDPFADTERQDNRDITVALQLGSRWAMPGMPRPLERQQLCEEIISGKSNLEVETSHFRDSMTAALEPLASFHNVDTDGRLNSVIASESRFSNIVNDIAPYVRSIVSYDIQLEEERLRLSNLLSEGGRAGKKQRTTRASRAALEGGNKAHTRRERWFTNDLSFRLILRTGSIAWQEALAEQMKKRASTELDSSSSSDVEPMETDTLE